MKFRFYSYVKGFVKRAGKVVLTVEQLVVRWHLWEPVPEAPVLQAQQTRAVLDGGAGGVVARAVGR